MSQRREEPGGSRSAHHPSLGKRRSLLKTGQSRDFSGGGRVWRSMSSTPISSRTSTLLRSTLLPESLPRPGESRTNSNHFLFCQPAYSSPHSPANRHDDIRYPMVQHIPLSTWYARATMSLANLAHTGPCALAIGTLLPFFEEKDANQVAVLALLRNVNLTMLVIYVCVTACKLYAPQPRAARCPSSCPRLQDV